MPAWFGNLLFWSAQVALLVAAGACLPRVFGIRQPRVLLAYWRVLLVVSLTLPVIQPWHRPAVRWQLAIAEDVTDSRARPTANTDLVRTALSCARGRLACGRRDLGGVGLRFMLLLGGLARLKQFRKRSADVPVASEAGDVLEEMCGRVGCAAEFRYSRDVDSPVTFGLRKADDSAAGRVSEDGSATAECNCVPRIAACAAARLGGAFGRGGGSVARGFTRRSCGWCRGCDWRGNRLWMSRWWS